MERGKGGWGRELRERPGTGGEREREEKRGKEGP